MFLRKIKDEQLFKQLKNAFGSQLASKDGKWETKEIARSNSTFRCHDKTDIQMYKTNGLYMYRFKGWWIWFGDPLLAST